MNRIIPIESSKEIQKIFGSHDENMRLIEDAFDIRVSSSAEGIKIASHKKDNLEKSLNFICQLLNLIRQGKELTRQDVAYSLKEYKQGGSLNLREERIIDSSLAKSIGPRTKGQKEYVDAIRNYDIVFSIGPAGTGKTYLAMAMAVEALKSGKVRRIILTRPAIEAGESLGYLPGDMIEKISPYLRPLYDALYDMMDAARIEKYLEIGVIEVAPLAYMRGRTLNDAFIILDEAQNCTHEQMKMFLTRLGFDSKAVITGDITQTDLPGGKPLGLLEAQRILSDIEGIKFVYFSYADVVRHALVQEIIEAYERSNKKDNT
ncbi:MAG: PhoH family protein [Candidatus Omnitrophica bacterium]|nr:PhoH family protein [Candidatus Omnitrophota bacterium]MDD5352525.1 PhoH family protein [Candidatus Omnitrophota bacterium]MDD5550123.1 PhoH family protein [Candidatus Omnitrophota bacterium]